MSYFCTKHSPMVSRWLALIVLCLFWGTSCQRKTQPATSSAPVEVPAVVPPPVDANKPTVLVAHLRRGPCFGQCPVYEVSIYSNGMAKWKGSANTPLLGSYRTTLPEGWLSALKARAEALGYFQLAAKYPTGYAIPDLPLTATFVLLNDKTSQKIENRGDAPTNLLKFERYFDEQISTLRWTREEGSPE
jgi:Domain of unknown function (DUF6438)